MDGVATELFYRATLIPLFLKQLSINAIGVLFLQGSLDCHLCSLEVGSIVAVYFNQWAMSADKPREGVNEGVGC